MSQGDLYLMLPLAWQNFLDQLAAFAAYSETYSAQTAADGLLLLTAAKKLPDEQARGAGGEMTRRQLLPPLTEYLDAWLRLEGYIEKAYGPAGYKAMREEAGGKWYDGAAHENWDSVGRLITSARNFVLAHTAELTANKVMPATFAALLETEAQEVELLLTRFLQLRSDEHKGTAEKEAANAAAFAAWMAVAKDADRIFRRQPELLKYFQTEYLLGIVRGTGQAGLRGTITLPDNAPATGVTVQVAGKPDAVAVTDEDGRYALAVPMGTYTVQLSGAGYRPLEVANVVVEAGVKKRMDGVVEKAG